MKYIPLVQSSRTREKERCLREVRGSEIAVALFLPPLPTSPHLSQAFMGVIGRFDEAFHKYVIIYMHKTNAGHKHT